MRNASARHLAMSGLVAALYVVLTLALASLAYQGVQFRVSEVLVLLAFIHPGFIPAVTLGTFIANLVGPFGIVDAIAGAAASAVAMVLIWQTKRLLGDRVISLFVASLWPVLLNALYVPLLIIFVDPTTPWAAFTGIALSVALGEFVVVSIGGLVIIQILKGHKSFIHLFDLKD